MKLLYLIKSFAMKAGVERVISDKINWLAESGYDIMLVTYEQGNHPHAYKLHPSVRHEDVDVRFFELAKYNLVKRLLLLFRYRSLFKKRFGKIIEGFSPDIMITTTYQLKIVDIILSVCSKSHNVIESHIACYKAQKSSESNGSFVDFLAKAYDRYFLGRVVKFDCLVVLTQGDSEDWRNYISSIKVIPNPVTIFPDSLPIHKEMHRIICIGRLHEQKGFDMLIEAVSKISNYCYKWHIDIFGEGNEDKKLLSLIEQKKLERVISIHPPVHTIFDEYMKSDFYVLSSRYEGFPLVLNEAMSCGIPCVAFRCKYGPEDAITDKVNGLLVENGNVDALAEAILWMIQHPEERKRMGIAARESAAAYKKSTIMKKWVELFDSLSCS